MTRRRAGVIASSPVLVGAITTLIVILAVFLAYNANNGLPVRAHLQDLGAGAEREHARQGQRRAHRRRAGRHRGDDRAGPGRRDRRGLRQGRPEARQERRAGAQGLDRGRAVALGAGAQVPGDQQGHLQRGLCRGRRPCRFAVATPEPVEIDQFLNIFDAPTRQAFQANLVELRRRAGRPRSGPERGPRRAPAPGHPPGAGGAQPRLPEDRSSGASSARWPTAPPRWRRSPRPKRRCSSPSTSTFGAFAEGGAPLHPGVDLRDAAHLRHADPDGAADQDASSAQRHAVRRASPGHQGAERQLAHDRGGVRDRRRRAARRTRR